MIKNYLKTALRHLWRNRLFTGLNIVGLTIGIAGCWVIYQLVSYEFSFDADLANKEQTYRLITATVYDGRESRSAGISRPLAQAISADVPEVNTVVPVFGQWITVAQASTETGQRRRFDEPQHIVATDAGYFDMVSCEWLAGDNHTALRSPDQVVMTESRAQSYFGNLAPQDMLGRSVVYDDTVRKTVSGIVKDLGYPSEFTAQEFFWLQPAHYQEVEWTNTSGSDKLYLQLAEGASPSAVLKKINAIADQHWNAFQQQTGTVFTIKRWFELLPMVNSHFSVHVDEYGVRKASKPVLYGLMAGALFLLLLACVNYINLQTAQLPQRAKAIGIHKILGGRQLHTISQLLAETLCTTALALLLAFYLKQLSLSVLSGWIMVDEVASFGHARQIAAFAAMLLLTVTLLSGIYPAWLISRIRLADIKRGQSMVGGTNRAALRRGFILFQFFVAYLFIVGALVMHSQLNHTLKRDLGFDKEAVVLIDIPRKLLNDSRYKDHQFALAEQLKSRSAVNTVSLGRAPLSSESPSSLFEYLPGDGEPRKRQVFLKWVDTAYMGLYQLDLLAGRNLQPSEMEKEYVINEAALHAFGFRDPQEAIGKMVGQPHQQLPVVGVVKNFHLRDFHHAIAPVALTASHRNLSTINIKLDSHDPSRWQEVLADIEAVWADFYPAEAFNYRFYDDYLAMLYRQERNLAMLVNLATTIAVIISCLGLFGLATLTVVQRTKEIGIRKVLGATVPSIMGMLSKDLVKLVLIAVVIASPIAWWATSKWLAEFAYRIDIEWWMFGLAALFALAVALLTVSSQAIKAAVANPVDSLRDE